MARSAEEGAAVGDPAERVDQGVDLILQLGSFFGHVQQQEGHDDGEQQRTESKQRERDAAHERLLVQHRSKVGCQNSSAVPAANMASMAESTTTRKFTSSLKAGMRQTRSHNSGANSTTTGCT